MNKEQFYNIISDSSLLTKVDEQSIDEIIKEFPYFQTAYVLKTKILSDKGSFKYDNFIKLASLYSVDRSKLYKYLHDDVIATNEVAVDVAKAIELKEVIENIADNIENNLDIESEIVKKEESKVEPEIIEENSEVKEVDKSSELDDIISEKSDKIEEEQQDKAEKIDVPKPIESILETASEKEDEVVAEIKIIEEDIDVNEDVDVVNVEESVKIEIAEEKEIKEEFITPVEVDNKTDKPLELKSDKVKEEHIFEPLSANATLAEKIIHKYKDQQKDDKKESIADIILRKAAEAKKKKATEKIEPVLREKPKEIKVEEKTFEPVKLEVKPEQKEPAKEVKPSEEVKLTEQIVEHKNTKDKKETIIVEDIPKIEVLKDKEPKIDILDEINKISEKETVSDYFIAEEVVETKPVKEEMSFDDWLKFVETPITSSRKNKEQISLIDKFITADANSNMKPKVDAVTDTEQLVKSGEVERDDFITETLANIYIKQKLYEKAIGAFTKLSLKYPEKNSYFANQIKKVEKLIKK